MHTDDDLRSYYLNFECTSADENFNSVLKSWTLQWLLPTYASLITNRCAVFFKWEDMDIDRGKEPVVSPIPVSSPVHAGCSDGEETDANYDGDDSDDADYDGEDDLIMNFVVDMLPKSKKAKTMANGRSTALSFNKRYGERCHYCRQTEVREHVHCSVKFCPVKFCGACLLNRNGEKVRVEMRSNVRWICPKCRGGCGRGCSTCCTCAPCRRSFKLEATGQVVRDARQIGFDNVHDYLIHLETGESPKEISRRKEGRRWTKDTGACYNSEEETTRAWGIKRVRSARKRPANVLRSKRAVETVLSGEDTHEEKIQCVILEEAGNSVVDDASQIIDLTAGRICQAASETQDSEDNNTQSQERAVLARNDLDLNQSFDDGSEDARVSERDGPCKSFLNESAEVLLPENELDLRRSCDFDDKTEIPQTDELRSCCLDEKEITVPSKNALDLNQSCSNEDEKIVMPQKDGSCRSSSIEMENEVLARNNLDLNQSLKDAHEKTQKFPSGSCPRSPDGSRGDGSYPRSPDESRSKDYLDILRDNMKNSKQKLTARRSARRARKKWGCRHSSQLCQDSLTPESKTNEDEPFVDVHERKDTVRSNEKSPSSIIQDQNQFDGKDYSFQPFECEDGGQKETKLNSFERGLELLYLRPFSLMQLQEMWEHVTVCGPSIHSRQQEINSGETQSTDEAPVYLDHYPDLAEKLTRAFHPQDKLKLLRGFFFWSQHAELEGSYRPWLTKQEGEDCDFTRSPNSQAVDYLLAIDCDEDLETDTSEG